MTGVELQEMPPWPPQGPGESISPDKSWSPVERWIWEKLQAGEIANIDEYEDESGRLPPADPKKPEDWRDGRRRLAPRFLEDLLLREPYRSGLHRKGVRIDGAWFDEAIDLSMAGLARPLWMDRCRFEKTADLKYLRTPAPLSLDGSAFAAELDLRGACINADLFMRSGAEFNDVVLTGAKVGGQVSLNGAKVRGALDMDSADIGQSLIMASDCGVSEHRAQFNKVVLNNAKVRGQVNLIGANVAGTLAMDSASVGQDLFMRSDSCVSEHRAEFTNDVILRGAKIGGQVSLIGAKVAGMLNMDSVAIGQSLFMDSKRLHRAELNHTVLNNAKVGGQVSLIGAKVTGTLNMNSVDIDESLFMRSDPNVSKHVAEFDGGVSLIFAEIRRNFDLRGAILSSLDLTGTRMDELTLASRSWSPRWQDGGKLVLRNASVDYGLRLRLSLLPLTQMGLVACPGGHNRAAPVRQ